MEDLTMIDIDGAEAYFAGHPRGAVWAAFPGESREAAVAHARRVLSRGLNRKLDDALDAYEEGDRYRDDYAVYEQALHMLSTGRVGDANAGAPYPVAMQPAGDGPTNPPDLYAPEALRWLGWTGAAVIRG